MRATYLVAGLFKDGRQDPQMFPAEMAYEMATIGGAKTMQMQDSIGSLEVGKKADVNVIDFERLKLRSIKMVHDLPAGGRRLLQKAEGYDYTIVSGEITRRNGEDTGARPGRLVRGGR